MTLKNESINGHAFLSGMAQDAYFPPHLVDKGKALLLALCARIEAEQPASLEALYALTHATTEQFNDLAGEFEDADSEIETAARDCIGEDMAFIAQSYGFDADVEELIATRDW